MTHETLNDIRDWHHEDRLPEGYPSAAMFPRSRIICGVRMFPPVNPHGLRETHYLTPGEAAVVLRCSTWTITRLATRGRLPGAISIGAGNRKRWRIPASALDALTESSTPDIAPPPNPDLVRNPFPHLQEFMK